MRYEPMTRSGFGMEATRLGTAGLLWVGLWAAIGTGPWAFDADPGGGIGWLHYLRTFFPLVVAGLAVVMLLPKQIDVQRESQAGWPWSLRLWTIYGVLAAVASSRSVVPLDALYWAVAYLGVLFAGRILIRGTSWEEDLQRARALSVLTWCLAAVFLGGLLVASRGRLFVEAVGGQSSYGVVGRVGEVGGVLVSRASGFARFASIPALIAFVLAVRLRGARRWVLAGLALAFAALVYLLQSRGAIVGLAAAALFVTIVLGGRARLAFGLVIVAVVVSVLADVIEVGSVERIEQHLTRGQSEESLRTLTGRTRAWQGAFAILSEDPWLGYGPQADRYLLKEHIHSTALYAWLAGGVAGVLAVLGGIALGWRDMLRALKRGEELGRTTRTLVLISAGLLVFFTVRSIPEVSGAMFGVDTLLMVPTLALLGIVGAGRDGEDS